MGKVSRQNQNMPIEGETSKHQTMGVYEAQAAVAGGSLPTDEG